MATDRQTIGMARMATRIARVAFEIQWGQMSNQTLAWQSVDLWGCGDGGGGMDNNLA